ncbi:hypothetical protein PsAD2_03081 [Pseudovibrio axinellae]|uniref:Uncharacterized protein n=1 Tax=Pseudovibrio axinellae TaxID=989403 RepID=A0A165XBF2_9HYPH|nr:hypothetical protein PsAD2_03081 [Pseudovibrio axinellae]
MSTGRSKRACARPKCLPNPATSRPVDFKGPNSALYCGSGPNRPRRMRASSARFARRFSPAMRGSKTSGGMASLTVALGLRSRGTGALWLVITSSGTSTPGPFLKCLMAFVSSMNSGGLSSCQGNRMQMGRTLVPSSSSRSCLAERIATRRSERTVSGSSMSNT